MSYVERELRRLSDVSFRELSGQLLYIEGKDILEKMADTEEIRPSSTGLIVYAYIDHENGLSCWPVVIADLEGDAVRIFDLAKSEKGYLFRINEGETEHSEVIEGRTLYMCHITPNHRFCNANVFGKLGEEFKPFREHIDRQYGMNDPDRILFRNNREWDHLRNKYWPDDFQVFLSAEGNDAEVVWVRAEHDANDEYIGVLLNEPYQDFGIHKGNMIGFKEFEKSNGELILYSTLSVWEREGLN